MNTTHTDPPEAATCCSSQPPSTAAKDPVCGMDVDTTRPGVLAHAHGGQTYYFCNPKCRDKFRETPDRYLAPVQMKESASASANEWFTCPMHPEVRQLGPGSCPKCGMALEAETIFLEQQENPELRTCRAGSGGASR